MGIYVYYEIRGVKNIQEIVRITKWYANRIRRVKGFRRKRDATKLQCVENTIEPTTKFRKIKIF